MLRAATINDVAEIVSQFARHPWIGDPLRRDPKQRESLYLSGVALVSTFHWSTARVERFLRAHLRDIYAL